MLYDYIYRFSRMNSFIKINNKYKKYCEEQINKGYKRIQEIFSQLDQSTDQKELIEEAQNCLKEASESLKQMEIELQGYDSFTRKNLNQSFQLQKQKLIEIRKIFDQQFASYQSNQLFGKQETKEFQQLQKQSQQNEDLEGAKFKMYGLEQQSADIMYGLNKNTDIMVRSKEKLISIRNDLGQSFQYIRVMTNRIRQNKLIMYVVLSIVLFGTIIIIFSHF
ncbi:hypothetical protein pb186bvf_000066 [Paramecium bursaria]